MSRKKIFIKIITKKSGLFPSPVYNTILKEGLFPFFFINLQYVAYVAQNI